MTLRDPYLLFLGDAPDPLTAKVAQGIRHWRPEKAVGQLRLLGCAADVGAPDMTVAEAVEAGAKTLIVGVANRGGVISPDWVATLVQALEAGMDLAAGLHQRLADVPELAEAASRLGRTIHDVRVPPQAYPVGSGEKRSGKRVLTVGTDCSVGKMYTSLALEQALREKGADADFRATGQTGILITGAGAPIDAVVADFISGAVETIAPAADPKHWDVIEGQGSLFHPSFAGVSTGLLHGAQPDALVLCHEPTRRHMRGLPHFSPPELEPCMEANLRVAALTNSRVQCVGLAINTSGMEADKAMRYLDDLSHAFGMPAVDPVRTGAAPLAQALLERVR